MCSWCFLVAWKTEMARSAERDSLVNFTQRAGQEQPQKQDSVTGTMSQKKEEPPLSGGSSVQFWYTQKQRNQDITISALIPSFFICHGSLQTTVRFQAPQARGFLSHLGLDVFRS